MENKGLAYCTELNWPRWHPAPGARPGGELGLDLAAFLEQNPGRPLLLVAPDLALLPSDARRLHAIARLLESPAVLTTLGNAQPELNPYAGLDTSRLEIEDETTGLPPTAPFSYLVTQLGSGTLHPLDFWPGHLAYLTPAAVESLARTGTTFDNARERLAENGGGVWASDCLFAASPGQPVNSCAELEPHEQLRPAPWGDLTARLEQHLAAGIRPEAPPANTEQSTSLHITHSWGGGVAQWVESFIAADRGGYNLQLRSEGPQTGQGAGQRLCLYSGNQLSAPIASWWLNPAIRSSAARHEHYGEVLEYIVRRYGIGRIIVSSLVGHCLDALRTGLPTIQVLHDFFPAWPLLDVHPEPWLESGSDNGLALALQQNELLPDFRDHDATAWRQLASEWRETVSHHTTQLIAPSRSVARLLHRLDECWKESEIKVIHHGLAPLQDPGPLFERPRADGKLRLVIPGRMQELKGQALLLAALPELTEHAQVYLLGAGKNGEVFFGHAGVNVILQYRREDLPLLMQAIAPDVAALLSIVPETFSYTLSELRQLGIPVIATRVGSLAERIHDGQDGWLIDPDDHSLVKLVMRLKADRSELAAVRARLKNVEIFTPENMVQAYDAVTPALVKEPYLARRASLAGLQASASAEQSARLEVIRLQQAQRIQELQAEVERRTDWAKERDRALETEQKTRAEWVRRLEAEIESGLHTIREQQNSLQQLDRVLASSSWRITRPLRVTRRVLTNLGRARAWNPFRWPLLLSQAIRTLSTQGFGGALLRFQQSSQAGPAPQDVLAHDVEPIGDPEPPRLMPRADKPEISIIIPVYNQWLHTAACLRSIARANNKASFEVIVVDDHSRDETEQRLGRAEGIRYLRNQKNSGFVRSCNRGSEAATGQFILLLNNDTQVLDGWLDALLDTFRRFPDTGLAGARLVYPDGRLQEAGGIIFKDGSGWNYGRGDDMHRPEYNFVREVDYCSGACIMMRTRLFRQLGGLDVRYAPAYYEDTDLAFRVRQAGFKVRVQTAATVIHHEGISSGTDPGSGTKRFQAVNRKKFQERWHSELDACPDHPGASSDRRAINRARDHRLKGRVLIIDAYTPEPDQDSGSLRLCYLFDCFRQLGYGVTFFADNRGYAGAYSAELQKSGVEVMYNPWLESLQDFFSSRGGEFGHVMISRHYVATHYIGLLQKYCPRAKFIFDTVDLHYLREERLAELENNLPLKRVAAQTRRSELAVIRKASATLVVSPVEKAVLARDAPDARVYVLSNIHRLAERESPFAERKDIFFVGGYQHPPNVDAAQWFVGKIWPLVHQALPDVCFHLIGSKAPDKVRALEGHGVIFHGFVQDLEPWLDGCRIAVAPLRYGAGVKGKVNLSMSHGQPVVATPMAIEGLHARDGEDVLVAETAEEFAAAIIRLYRDEALWRRLAQGGRENVRQYFSVDRARENLANILDALETA